MMRIKFFAAAAVLVLTSTAFAAAPAAHRATGVKAILVGDTNAFPNGDAANDVASVERYLRGLPGFDAQRDLRVIEGNDDTAENILEAIDEIDVEPTDVLFFYYEGHGAYDPNESRYYDPSGGHMLQITNGDLLRSDLMNHLLTKDAQLTVCITETCNVATTYCPQGHTLGEAPPEKVVSASLQTLLYNYTGVVDVNAAQRGESSWSNPDGGWFTQTMLQVLSDDDVLSPLSGLVPAEDWTSFLDRVSDKTHNVFAQEQKAERTYPKPNKDLLKQKDQRPQVFVLNVKAVGGDLFDDNYVPPPPPPVDLFGKSPFGNPPIGTSPFSPPPAGTSPFSPLPGGTSPFGNPPISGSPFDNLPTLPPRR
ncbi:MAG TPA: caspase family protein [Gemmataceae bacterium]|nr:caspase family protein [Gemmataceae bacterium]